VKDIEKKDTTCINAGSHAIA